MAEKISRTKKCKKNLQKLNKILRNHRDQNIINPKIYISQRLISYEEKNNNWTLQIKFIWIKRIVKGSHEMIWNFSPMVHSLVHFTQWDHMLTWPFNIYGGFVDMGN
jgi:hypothetical protein